VAALAVAVSTGCGAPLAPSPLPSPAATREGRWVQDADYLAGELARLHPNLFFHTPREEFDRTVDEVRRAAPVGGGEVADPALFEKTALALGQHDCIEIPRASRRAAAQHSSA